MITQYQITLSPECAQRIEPEWGYHFYAALLSLLPRNTGDRIHGSGITPFSSYVTAQDNNVHWQISLLGQESEKILSPVLERQERYFLRRENQSLRVTEIRKKQIQSVEELLALPENRVFKLHFVTPTAFKSEKQYINLPSVPFIMRNLLKKWNGCFAEECPIEDEDGEGIGQIAAGLRIADYRLSSSGYFLKGQTIPGFTGEAVLKCRLDGFHLTAANLLLHFAPYAGIGIKTALGMGGVRCVSGRTDGLKQR